MRSTHPTTFLVILHRRIILPIRSNAAMRRAGSITRPLCLILAVVAAFALSHAAAQARELRPRFDPVDPRAEFKPLIGKTVYADALSVLMTPDSSIDQVEINEPSKRFSFEQVPYFVPLPITDVQYVDDKYGTDLIVSVRIPDGREAIYLNRDFRHKGDLLGDVAKPLHARIPATLAAREVTAIREHGYFIGMSEEALHMSQGLPTRENDYGRGGRQVIYDFPHGAQLIFYFGASGRVRDYQRIGF